MPGFTMARTKKDTPRTRTDRERKRYRRDIKADFVSRKAGDIVANPVVNLSQKSMPLFPKAVKQIVRLTFG